MINVAINCLKRLLINFAINFVLNYMINYQLFSPGGLFTTGLRSRSQFQTTVHKPALSGNKQG